MKFESKTCQWCWQSVPLDPARIVSDRMGAVVLRGKDGRMHSFGRSKKENDEQQTEQVGAPEGTRRGEAITEDSETEAFLRFSESVFGE
jgi:hypothetical protein